MIALSDLAFRKTISARSKKFAEEKFGPFAVLERLVLNYGKRSRGKLVENQ
jgi:hypothetical protein